MKTLHLTIIVVLSLIVFLSANTASAETSKQAITVNDTQYEILLNSTNSTVNVISPNLHSYIHNSLDMNITNDDQYNGSLTLTLTKDAAANVFCVARSEVDNQLKNVNMKAIVDKNPENFTTSTTGNEISVTFGIPKDSTNATIVNQFVGMAVSPLVYFKGIPETGSYKAGQDVTFNGTLVDACGRHLGEETVYFTAEQFNVTKKVTSSAKGKFSVTFTIPEDTESGHYASKFEMYEYGSAYNLSGIENQDLDVSADIVPPLKQFKSGIPANIVKCDDSLQLVIKADDGVPACVRPDNVSKLVYRGWAKEFIQSVAWTNKSACEGTVVPSGNFQKNIFPVLAMPVNSTATVCVTYNIKSDWQSYHNKDVYPYGILETCCFVHMGWYSNPSLSHNFVILANPPLANVTNVSNGSKISVIYKIYAEPNSSGFYDTSVPFSECLSYPLAVGYNFSEIYAAKFHADFAIPCFNAIQNVDSVKIVSGMTFKEVQFS